MSAELFAEIERLSREIDARQREIDRWRKESGCPDGKSLFLHVFGVPLFPESDR